MMTIEHDRKEYLVIRASGKLTSTDYDAAVPEIENAMSLMQRKPRVLILLEDFHGWEPEAAWKDLRFDMKHYDDFGRIAIVGEGTLEKWMIWLARPFIGAETRYFDRSERQKAEKWLSG